MIVQCRAAAALREREQAPPLSVLQIFRSVVDDPVARAAPAPADIIDRPSSIVAPNLRTTIPLNRNGDVNQQPLRRPGGSSRSLCSAQPRPMRLGPDTLIDAQSSKAGNFAKMAKNDSVEPSLTLLTPCYGV